MSRRPRAPLSLRLLGREESMRTPLEIDAGETTRLADPLPETGNVTLAPALESSLLALVPDIPRTPQFPLAPPVDVVPASLVSATFALRRVELRFPPPKAEKAELFGSETRSVPIPSLAPSLSARPAAALVRRVSPMPLERIERPLLRECLEALYRASGAADANDLALVGVYDRVPVGAIAGASATPAGLELRLTAGTRARRGHLVVGRRRSSGALVTAEVPSQVAPK
jgi:hypothetical protein